MILKSRISDEEKQKRDMRGETYWVELSNPRK